MKIQFFPENLRQWVVLLVPGWRAGEAQRGTSLVEAIIGLGLVAMIASVAAARIGQIIRQMRVEDAKAVLNQVGMQLRDDLGNPDNLRISSDIGLENTEFAKCVAPLANQNACVTTNANKPRPFILYRIKKGAPKPEKLSGTETSPAYYGTRGELCSGPNQVGCYFKAYSTFWATCPLDASDKMQQICSTSQMVNFRLVVEVIDNRLPNFLASLKGSRFPATGGDIDFVVRVPTAHIIQKGAVHTCGIGQIQDGYEPDGRPRCKCPGSDDPVPPTQRCLNACNPGEYLGGFNADGQSRCVSIKECSAEVSSCAEFAARRPDCPCDCIPTETNVKKECAKGRWITGVNWGECTAKSVGKKGGDSPITCTGGFMLCCTTRF